MTGGKKRIKIYRIGYPFQAIPGSNINWDTRQHGLEGVGIRLSFLRKCEPYEIFRVVLMDSGRMYEINKKTVMMHEDSYNTMKTYHGQFYAGDRRIIIPLTLMKYIGHADIAEVERSPVMEAPDQVKKFADPRLSLFSLSPNT